MKILLITGGAGFVGASLAVRFKASDASLRVVALDNLSRRGSELNLPRLRLAGVEFKHGDVRNPEDLEAVGSFDVLIECSAEPSVLAGFDGSPLPTVNTNLVGAINCLEATRHHRAGIVFLSTSRVYPMEPLRRLSLLETPSRFELAPQQSLPGVTDAGISELFPLDGCRSLYGATKLAAELLLQEYVHMYDMRGVINRCSVLTGPWQMGKTDQGVVALWAARHFFGGNLSYIGYGGAGKQVRDLLHVDDLYRLISLEIADLGRHNGAVYNVGGGTQRSVSLCELTRLCEELFGRRIDIGSAADERPADIPYFVTDSTKVRQATGWEPVKTVADILADIRAWLVEHRAALEPVFQGKG